MKTLTALREFRYGGAMRKAGDVFQASDRDALILCAKLPRGAMAQYCADDYQPTPAAPEPPPEPVSISAAPESAADDLVEEIEGEAMDDAPAEGEQPKRRRYVRKPK